MINSFKTDLTICKFIEIIIQVFLITLVIVRWMMQTDEKQVTQEQVSALLLQYISAGSDIVDFYGIIEYNSVATNEVYVYAILGKFSFLFNYLIFLFNLLKKLKGVFSLSVFQFSVTLTAKRGKSTKTSFIDHLFGNESWSVALVMLTQDLPFLIVRICVIATFNVTENFTIYYFTIKNAILVTIELYRIVTVCKEHAREITEVKPFVKTE